MEKQIIDRKRETDGFKWDVISQWLHMNVEQITPEQLTALAQTFLSMECIEDIQKFIASGYRLVFIDQDHPSNMYELTDTFKAFAEAIERTVAPLALATVWSTNLVPEEEARNIGKMVQQMKILQIIVTVASRVPWTCGGGWQSNVQLSAGNRSLLRLPV